MKGIILAGGEGSRLHPLTIAASQGYRDVGSFSRAFRRWTGAAPRAWRNQWLSPQSDRQDDGIVS